eukprot:571944-Prymnesium_polylepis.1
MRGAWPNSLLPLVGGGGEGEDDQNDAKQRREGGATITARVGVMAPGVHSRTIDAPGRPPLARLQSSLGEVRR